MINKFSTYSSSNSNFNSSLFHLLEYLSIQDVCHLSLIDKSLLDEVKKIFQSNNVQFNITSFHQQYHNYKSISSNLNESKIFLTGSINEIKSVPYWLIKSIDNLVIDEGIKKTKVLMKLIKIGNFDSLSVPFKITEIIRVKNLITSNLFKTNDFINDLTIDTTTFNLNHLKTTYNLTDLRILKINKIDSSFTEDVISLMNTYKKSIEILELPIFIIDRFTEIVTSLNKFETLKSLRLIIQENEGDEHDEIFQLYVLLKQMNLINFHNLKNLSIQYIATVSPYTKSNNFNTIRFMMVLNLLQQVDWDHCKVNIHFKNINVLDDCNDVNVSLISQLPISLTIETMGDVDFKEYNGYDNNENDNLKHLYSKYPYLQQSI